MMAKATSADECRLVLDMAFLQAGFKLDFDDAEAQAVSIQVSKDEESSLVEALLNSYSYPDARTTDAPTDALHRLSNNSTYKPLSPSTSNGKMPAMDSDPRVLKEDNSAISVQLQVGA